MINATRPFAAPRILLLTLLAAGAAVAQAQTSLYSGEAPVASQDEVERARALGPALLQALVKVSGDASLRGDAVRASLEQAPALLRSFSYRQDIIGTSGQPVVHTLLVAQFDRAGVESLLTQLGRPVWSGERPLTVIWLVIDDGSVKRVASASQAGALGALIGAARDRGVPLRFPNMDATDATRVGPEVLWHGPASGASAASRRYGTSFALVVRLARTGAGWTGRFTLSDGNEGADWSASGPDSNTVLVAAATGLADRLARRYAIAADERQVAEYRVAITGLRSGADYGTVMGFLGRLSAVGAAIPDGAEGDRLLLKLTLNVSLARFRQMLAMDPVLAFDDAPPDEHVPPERRVQATLRLVQR